MQSAVLAMIVDRFRPSVRHTLV